VTRLAAVLLALALLAGCGGARETREPDVVVRESTPADESPVTGGGDADVHIWVVTHGQASSAFWTIVRNGIEAARRQMGVELTYRSLMGAGDCDGVDAWLQHKGSDVRFNAAMRHGRRPKQCLVNYLDTADARRCCCRDRRDDLGVSYLCLIRRHQVAADQDLRFLATQIKTNQHELKA